MPKIAFIGAGSMGFTRALVRDILTFPRLKDATLALMDIDPERLKFARRAVQSIVDRGRYPAKVEATLDRRAALKGADAVLCTILSHRVNVFRHDLEIPKRYGVDTNIGDTRGPSGVFRALRTIPVMWAICRDIERGCPDAIFLNYTNPMTMLCRAMQRTSAVRLAGLCHSVQGTAGMLADWIGAPMDRIDYLCAGINHQAWFLEFKKDGRDAYPPLRRALRRPEIYRRELVRNEMFLALGYYVSESSGHNSEYNWWFRKRPDLIRKYCLPGTGWNPGKYGYILDEYNRGEKTWKREVQRSMPHTSSTPASAASRTCSTATSRTPALSATCRRTPASRCRCWPTGAGFIPSTSGPCRRSARRSTRSTWRWRRWLSRRR
jgi:alpha-galactosidase